jgi:hypothetical protein
MALGNVGFPGRCLADWQANRLARSGSLALALSVMTSFLAQAARFNLYN